MEGSTSSYTHRDHPRMRGEHSGMDATTEADTGSSPHARGTHERRVAGRHRHGIIPACAGNTLSLSINVLPRWDHPRMRGEHEWGVALIPKGKGSSPHARGTHTLFSGITESIGIIPACAGNTLMVSSCATAARDHPRMRGEHATSHDLVMMVLGSSPHARGTRTVTASIPTIGGIIPACAGNTSNRSSMLSPDGDHPRMRGEHLLEGP